jgi:hypothetical protein
MKPCISLFGSALLFATLLHFDCSAQPRGAAADRFKNGPKPGAAAPDFELKDLDGKTVHASVLWSNKPTLIMTGSHTCPVFRGKVEAFEGLRKEFGDKMNFVVLYTIEAHPKGDPCPYTGKEWVTEQNEKAGLLVSQPKTMERREERARTCVRECKLTAPVVVDQMDNAAWKAYGGAPNSACLVGRDGRVIEEEGWFNPEKMRAAIEKALAASAN